MTIREEVIEEEEEEVNQKDGEIEEFNKDENIGFDGYIGT